MNISPVRNVAPVVRPAPVNAAKPAQPAPAPVKAAPVAVPGAVPAVPTAGTRQGLPKAQTWTAGRIAKGAGSAAGGFVAGGAATVLADLLFHFGNNGGTAWPGGIYLMGAGLAAAGALALYAKLSSK